MAKLVALTIDGRQVSVPQGTLIVNAAKSIGIDIPVFCYHPKMEPVGMCRQCMVEIGRPVIDRATGQAVMEGDKPKIGFGPKLETACTTPVSDGMVVLSQSDKAKASQKEILEFLLTSHPLDCPVCDKGGECPLQNLTMAHASPQSRYIFDEKHHAEKHFQLGDLIWLDRERCIQCARCVRFQDEIAGEPVLAFYQRGRSTDIITNSEPGFDSIFSGNTTDICPVGALTTADFRFGARPWEMKAAASICGQCPVGCNITFNTRREARSDGGSPSSGSCRGRMKRSTRSGCVTRDVSAITSRRAMTGWFHPSSGGTAASYRSHGKRRWKKRAGSSAGRKSSFWPAVV